MATTTTWALVKEEKWHLCSTCQSMIDNFLDRGLKDERTVRVSASADSKCALCRAMVQGFKELWNADDRIHVSFDDCFSDWQSKHEDSIKCSVHTTNSIKVWFGGLYISLTIHEDARQFNVPPGCTFKLVTDHDGHIRPNSIQFMRDQLSDCLSRHSHGGQRSNLDTQWPSRLLKIMSDQVILVDFHISMASGFAALSYCWGDQQAMQELTLQLNASTDESLRSGVPMSALPLTLRQAVLVCQKLTMEYIWIDALCIYQDNLSDWANESKKMATVYSTAQVTIIAAAATSSHSGFLHGDLSSIWLDSPLEPPLGLLGQVENATGFHGKEQVSWVIPDPIDTRGWTFQEQLLSTRVLRFTKNDLQWQCHTGSSCLCKQSNFRGLKVHASLNSDVYWDDVMLGFSARDFTFAIDKLPALSGLARKFQSLYSPDRRIKIRGQMPAYIAGCWEQELLPSKAGFGFQSALVWAVSLYGDNPPQCYETFVAPSFSWLSVRAKLFLPSLRGYKPMAEVLDFGTTPVSDDNLFGRISDGFLVLRGPVLPCIVSFPDSSSSNKVLPDVNVSYPLWSVARWFQWDCHRMGQGRLEDGSLFLYRSAQECTSDGKNLADVVLLCSMSTGRGPDGKELASCFGLVLGWEPSGMRRQRLGLAQIDLDNTALKEFTQTVTIA